MSNSIAEAPAAGLIPGPSEESFGRCEPFSPPSYPECARVELTGRIYRSSHTSRYILMTSTHDEGKTALELRVAHAWDRFRGLP